LDFGSLFFRRCLIPLTLFGYFFIFFFFFFSSFFPSCGGARDRPSEKTVCAEIYSRTPPLPRHRRPPVSIAVTHPSQQQGLQGA
jgi:hypothetical protein